MKRENAGAFELDRCYFGDVRAVLREMIAAGTQVHCIVTSPPYWGLRSYLPADHPHKQLEIGSEPTLAQFLDTMVDVFDLCRQVLRDDGTLWVNMGDSYAGGGNGAANYPASSGAKQLSNRGSTTAGRNGYVPKGLKPKDLVGQPWRLAFALQDAGWWLRQDNVWNKPNPMPESVTDRFTKAHEYVFMLAKSERYFFDQAAVLEPTSPDTRLRMAQNVLAQLGSERANGGPTGLGKSKGNMRAVGRREVPPGSPKDGGTVLPRGVGWGHGTDAEERGRTRVMPGLPGNVNPPKGQAAYEAGDEFHRTKGGLLAYAEKARGAAVPEWRNKRSVWTIPTESFSGAHFATFPRKLVEPCILAGCPAGGTVLDPFFGSGTTGAVARQLGRHFLGIDINDANEALQAGRISPQHSLFMKPENEPPPTWLTAAPPVLDCVTDATILTQTEKHRNRPETHHPEAVSGSKSPDSPHFGTQSGIPPSDQKEQK